MSLIDPTSVQVPKKALSDMASKLDVFRQSSQDLREIMLEFVEPAERVLVVKKPDPSLMPAFMATVQHLLACETDLVVHVEENVLNDELDPALRGEKLRSWSWKTGTSSPSVYGAGTLSGHENFAQIDLIICLGGDGTLMFVASQFQKMDTPVPPMMAFSLGSLGFLTPFNHNGFEHCLDKVLHGLSPVTLRMRLKCKIVRTSQQNLDTVSTEDSVTPGMEWSSNLPGRDKFAVSSCF